MNIGDRLRTLREEKRLTQDEIERGTADGMSFRLPLLATVNGTCAWQTPAPASSSHAG